MIPDIVIQKILSDQQASIDEVQKLLDNMKAEDVNMMDPVQLQRLQQKLAFYQIKYTAISDAIAAMKTSN
ncbi:hypothetical protein BGX31_010547 [Mortierella sp. GBA43]|nr:hypothetical protein BGX31_010547 [Mortierella sp. GBA43]